MKRPKMFEHKKTLLDSYEALEAYADYQEKHISELKELLGQVEEYIWCEELELKEEVKQALK